MRSHAQGFISRVPHYNSIFNVLGDATLTDTLHDLIEGSAAPLSAVEKDFAVDSTGFGTSQHFRYYSVKYQREKARRVWIKAHAMVGVKTNIVTSVNVLPAYSSDSRQFLPLMRATQQHFPTIREISADKAYLDSWIVREVDKIGAVPFIPFKVNSHPSPYAPVWTRMLHYFSLHREDFLAHYHKRSNVETTFSMIKRVFGDSVRSKTETAQTNEVLLKVLCHNIRVLIHEMHELGIDLAFRAGVNHPGV